MNSNLINYGSMLPLSQHWERSTIKELTTIAHGLVHGSFATPQELRDKLADVIGWLSTEYCGDSMTIGIDLATASTEYSATTIAGAYMQAIEPLPPLPAPNDRGYAIINGQCSRCGQHAEPIEWFSNGEVGYSPHCQHCDSNDREVEFPA